MSGATFLPIAVHAFYGTLRMLWVKAFHIVFIASWFAGLFYLPRIFVNLAMETERAAITRAIIMMAQAMGMKTVAEGVETLGQLEFLREVGCDEFQGYLLTRPLEPAAVQDLVRENARRYGERVPRFS